MYRPLVSEQPIRTNVDDLENYNFLEKKERALNENASTGSPSKEKQVDVIGEPRYSPVRVDKKTRYHHLQVLDEDAENFKVKLDTLLNGFRAETISEFMSIKRALLEEQAVTIENETRRYTKLLEQKTNELDKTKETLVGKIKYAERAEVIMNVLATWTGAARTKKKEGKLLSKYFNSIKLFKRYADYKKKIVKISQMHHKRNYERFTFNCWKEQHLQNKTQKLKKDHEENLNRELSELASKYNKEIDLLTAKLNETTKLLDDANRHKLDMQENLKKAFMRGVCALNFEAMSILQPSGKTNLVDENQAEKLYAATQSISNRISDLGSQFNLKDIHPLVVNPLDDSEHTGTFQNLASSGNVEGLSQSMYNEREKSPKKNVVFYQHPRPESKEARWKEAPIVGSNQTNSFVNTRKEILQIKRSPERDDNKENDVGTVQPLAELRTSAYEEDEGKVIKVNNGKSYLSGPQAKEITKKTSTVSITAKDVKGSKVEDKVTLTTGKPSAASKNQQDKGKQALKK